MKDSKDNLELPDPWKLETWGGTEEIIGPRDISLKFDKHKMEVYTTVKVYGDSWTSYQDVYEYIPLEVLAVFLERNGYEVKKREP
jgi:hypothetical protein